MIYSLCDISHNALLPWAMAGFQCTAIDIKPRNVTAHANISHVQCDLRDMQSLPGCEFVMAWPPCTDLARSGASHWKAKGEERAVAAVSFVRHCISLAGDCRLIVENPIGRLSTLLKPPSAIVQPWWYSTEDNYTKATCLWTFNGARLPARSVFSGEPDKIRVVNMSPVDRGSLASVTPMGLARAIFAANRSLPMEVPMPRGFDWI